MAHATKISLEQAKPNKLFYIVPNAIVYRPSDRRCLLLKRSQTEKVFPGKWATTGGKLEHADFDMTKPDRILAGDMVNFVNPIGKLLQREIREEADIKVAEAMIYTGKNILAVRPEGIPLLFMLFVATYKSGVVKPEPGAFTDFAWVNAREAKQYDCVEGVPEEIKQAIALFKKPRT